MFEIIIAILMMIIGSILAIYTILRKNILDKFSFGYIFWVSGFLIGAGYLLLIFKI